MLPMESVGFQNKFPHLPVFAMRWHVTVKCTSVDSEVHILVVSTTFEPFSKDALTLPLHSSNIFTRWVKFFFPGVYILGLELSQILGSLSVPLRTAAGEPWPSSLPGTTKIYENIFAALGQSSSDNIKSQGKTNNGATLHCMLNLI